MDAKAAPRSRRKQSGGSAYDTSVIRAQRRTSRPTPPVNAELPPDRLAVALQQARQANPTAPPVQAVNQPLEPPKPAEQPPGASPADVPAPPFPSSVSARCCGGACNAHVVLGVLVALFIVALVTFIIFYRLMLKHSQLESTAAAEHRDWRASGEFTAIAVEHMPAPEKPAPSGGIRSTESTGTQGRGGRVPTDAYDEVSPMMTEATEDEIIEDNNATVSSLGHID